MKFSSQDISELFEETLTKVEGENVQHDVLGHNLGACPICIRYPHFCREDPWTWPSQSPQKEEPQQTPN